MKELVKHLIAWVAGFFNAGVYLTDKLDSLILRLQVLKVENYEAELDYLQSLSTLIDITKFAIMLVTLLFCYFSNEDQINKGVKRIWVCCKKTGAFFKTNFISLFKNK